MLISDMLSETVMDIRWFSAVCLAAMLTVAPFSAGEGRQEPSRGTAKTVTAMAEPRQSRATEPEFRVIDGDTLVLIEPHPQLGPRQTRLRLEGVDAPELAQSCRKDAWPIPCGRIVAAALKDHLAGRRVSCTLLSLDRYGRWIARCGVLTFVDTRTAFGAPRSETRFDDIAVWLARSGFAVAYEAAHRPDILRAEAEAKRARRGLWGTEFVAPAEFRTSRRL